MADGPSLPDSETLGLVSKTLRGGLETLRGVFETLCVFARFDDFADARMRWKSVRKSVERRWCRLRFTWSNVAQAKLARTVLGRRVCSLSKRDLVPRRRASAVDLPNRRSHQHPSSKPDPKPKPAILGSHASRTDGVLVRPSTTLHESLRCSIGRRRG